MKTHQQKIEDIRRACIAVNDDITKLQFGCKLLRYSHGDYTKVYYVLEKANFGTDQIHISSIPFGDMTVSMEKDDIRSGGEFEIIGRPIRLADIVGVIKEGKDKDSAMDAVFVCDKWDCEKDNLEDQSEPTIDFLWSLLCKE